jgi:hypothetical protein
MSNPISFSLQILRALGVPPFLALRLLTKIRIVTSALQDERDDQGFLILEMPQQGSVEALDLFGKPFGHAQRKVLSLGES